MVGRRIRWAGIFAFGGWLLVNVGLLAEMQFACAEREGDLRESCWLRVLAGHGLVPLDPWLAAGLVLGVLATALWVVVVSSPRRAPR